MVLLKKEEMELCQLERLDRLVLHGAKSPIFPVHVADTKLVGHPSDFQPVDDME